MNKIQIEELKKEELTELLRKIIREEAEKLQPDHEELITREEVAQLFHANKDIKNIARRAGITSPVRVTELKDGMKVDLSVEKCTRISTHTARRSGATNMYKAGIPSISIMKITGHTTEVNFLKYICIDREENAEVLYNNQFFNGKFKKIT